MTRARASFLALIGAGLVAAAWSCTAFQPDASSEGTDSGAVDGANPDAADSQTAMTDANASDVWNGTPCPGAAGNVLFTSSFDGGDIAPWIANQLGDASISTSATDGGAAHFEIPSGNPGITYAVLDRTLGASPHFAVEFSFVMAPLVTSYTLHQATEESGRNLSLVLRDTQWQLLNRSTGEGVAVGVRGNDGATHTLVYRVERRAGLRRVEGAFDNQPFAGFNVEGDAGYTGIQIGPFWPIPSPAPAVKADFFGLTVWACSP